MKQTFAALKDICQRFLLQEKILIVPSQSAGFHLVQAYVKEGKSLLNLRTETVASLAEQICKTYLFENKLKVVSSTLVNQLMLELLKDLNEKDQLTYFNRLEVTTGISEAVCSALRALKLAGVGCSEVTENQFLNKAKGRDLQLIFAEYERVMGSKGYIDRADLYSLAIKLYTDSASKPVYVVPENLKLEQLEQKFIDLLTKDSLQILPIPSVKGLSRPKSFLVQEASPRKVNDNPLNFLYDLNNRPEQGEALKIDMFQAYGENNEVKEVIRRIKANKLPLDQVAVFYTAKEPYVQLFHDLAQYLELPITFGQGINIRNTYPGRLFFGLLEWLKSDFQVAKLYPLINSNVLKLEGAGIPYAFTVARVLRDSGIGWGRLRYLPQLEKQFAELEEKIEATGSEARRMSYRRRAEEILAVKKVSEDLLGLIPELNGDKVDYSDFVGSILYLIDNYSNLSNEADKDAKEIILAELRLVLEQAEEELSLDECLARLESIVEGQGVNSSPARPGFIHLDSFDRGLWIQRPYTFIVGLSAQRFPRQAREDAILLDEERRNIGFGLALSKEQTKESLYEMTQLLLSLSQMTFSFSAFDTVENRELFPAPLLLQIHRLLERDETKDYSSLLKALDHQKGFVPKELNQVLDEAEWWLYQSLQSNGIYKPMETVEEHYTSLKQGLQAQKNRKSGLVTEYDGKLKKDTRSLDPRENHELVVSSSQLETLAKCPFGYFLRYVLRVKPPEDLDYDPGVWLDAATRGSLLHRIFEEFYQELKVKEEQPRAGQHQELLCKLAHQVLEAVKEELPPPSLMVYEYEYSEIMESCKIFLTSEEEHSQGDTPCYFELSFGLKGATQDLDSEEPVSVTLPSGAKFNLRGKIDRVDQSNDGTYKTLDYKTGSTWAYNETKYFKGGRQLQHTLYSVALEKLLEAKKPQAELKVSEGGYIFPTLKGEGQRIMRSQSQEKRVVFYEVLENLLDILKDGSFTTTSDQSDCKFCDYIEVCERGLLEASFLEKLENLSNTELEKLRRLRTYE